MHNYLKDIIRDKIFETCIFAKSYKEALEKIWDDLTPQNELIELRKYISKADAYYDVIDIIITRAIDHYKNEDYHAFDALVEAAILLAPWAKDDIVTEITEKAMKGDGK